MAIRVLIVDDLPVIRSGFRALLDAEKGTVVVGEAADGEQAVDMARSLLPDVVLMDVRMPGTDGIDATRRITSDPSSARAQVLAVTTEDDDGALIEVLRAGAAGFLLKDASSQELNAAIKAVACGDALISPRVTRRLIDRVTALPEPPLIPMSTLRSLSPRELDVLGLVAAGFTNDNIANHLCISPHTVKTYIQRVMRKLDAHDRAQLVVIAYRTGLAKADEPSRLAG